MDKRLNAGAVLGIDVGFSERKKTTCFCLLSWDKFTISLNYKRAGTNSEERVQVLKEVIQHGRIEGAAVDGPMTRGLKLISHYRSAEALLSRGKLQSRCKPGQTSAPVGQKLHWHATFLANLTLQNTRISESYHFQPIHKNCIVEAFPNAFLASLIPESELPITARDASDRYWETTVEKGYLDHLIGTLLPDRDFKFNLQDVKNHEIRAGIICAITALAVVSGMYVGVGDPEDGDIILPPHVNWGYAEKSNSRWMEQELRENIYTVRKSFHPNYQKCRLTFFTNQWIP